MGDGRYYSSSAAPTIDVGAEPVGIIAATTEQPPRHGQAVEQGCCAGKVANTTGGHDEHERLPAPPLNACYLVSSRLWCSRQPPFLFLTRRRDIARRTFRYGLRGREVLHHSQDKDRSIISGLLTQPDPDKPLTLMHLVPTPAIRTLPSDGRYTDARNTGYPEEDHGIHSTTELHSG